MYTHIDAYIMAKYGQEILPFMTEEDIRFSLTRYFGFTPTANELITFLAYSPNDKQNVTKALRSLDLSQEKIARLMGISQGMVSRYLKKPWTNHFYPSKYIHHVRTNYKINREEKLKYFYDTYCNDLPGFKFN